jgi:hypothetical protein
MEPRNKHRTRKKSRGLKKSAVGKHSASNPLHLPNIEELIEVGQIKVGVIPKLWNFGVSPPRPTTNIITWPCWYAEKARPWQNC